MGFEALHGEVSVIWFAVTHMINQIICMENARMVLKTNGFIHNVNSV